MNVLSATALLAGILICSQSTMATPLSVKVPKYLCIYYGWPSAVNNSQGSVTAATNVFKQFDLIVFGGALANGSHLDHNKTVNITQNLVALGKRVFGYVDLGVSTTNLTYAQMQASVDSWAQMGSTGIFWDDAGFDYNVTRQRQSDMVNYTHSKGMNVIMNAWNPDDVLGGNNVKLNSSDIYILESYLISNGTYQSLTDWATKAAKCAAYQCTLGVQIACLSTTNTNDQFLQAWFGTAIYNFDYFQATDITYSTNSSLTFHANPSNSYGTTWKSANIIANTANTNFSRSTEAWQLSVIGNGASYGYGTFSPTSN